MNDLEQITQEHAQDWATFQQTGELTETLYNKLFWHFCSTEEMPYDVATQHATATQDPYEWITERLQAKETG